MPEWVSQVHTRILARVDMLPGVQTITFAYDASNRLQAVTYPDTTSRTYVYNEASLTGGANLPWALTGIIDESATRFASFTYDAQGRATRSEHAGGAGRVTVAYAAGGVRTVTDSLNAARTFNYSTLLDASRNTGISQSCSACGGAAQTLQYDANANVSSRTDFNENVTTYGYDLARNLETSRTEAVGSPVARTIGTAWHATHRLPSQIDEPGRRTVFTHDGSGNVLTRTVTDLTVTPNASRTWIYTYDVLGRMLTENGPRTDINDITTYTYYSCTTGAQCGQIQTITNALNHVTTFSSYNAQGQPLTITDPNGVVTTFTYDLRQRITSRSVGGETTSFTYFPAGLLRRVTLPDTSFIEYTYDAAHRLTEIEDGENNRIVYTLDLMGNRTREDVYDPSAALARTRSWVYNSLSRLAQEIGAAGTAAVTTVFGYDDNGNQTSNNAPLARNTANQYDTLNRLTQTTDPANGVTRYDYNALDQLISVTDPRNLVTSYEHNAFGEVIEQTSPDTGVTTHTYDSAGNLATRIDARGAGTSQAIHTYDALNRLVQIQYPDHMVSYGYDSCVNGKARLCSMTDASGSTSYDYDAQGRVTRKGQTVHLAAGYGTQTREVRYAYSNGRLIQLTMPEGHRVNYAYDSACVIRPCRSAISRDAGRAVHRMPVGE